ncbi:SDR family oxidoreductase [Sulfitobacter sp. R18_1]|uniref:SDR family oxidoreductase n=1 Tax=Sulfitobacter sp. R18_1 TaxID=2821104 RepID=UPI001ADC7EBA|nr:SDR family oxidoreductase [Sulfitobacter sp. R18_1]MBO9431009.1 SDR family oxidoreductase [Sulfitobacter sp. R18_1]
MDMTGKTIMITGASRGIGAAAARVFAEAGANVALLARSQDAIAELAGELGNRAIAIPCDVTRYNEMTSAVETTRRAFGGLDVLINNAGVIDPISPMAEADPADWAKAININVTGVFHGMRAALPLMKENGNGTVLTISSGAAHNPVEAWSHYCASKAAANMLTQCLHHEEGGNGIRAIGLSPGTVATDMQRDIKDSGVNPVSQLDWDVHIPADWPARTLLWMCGPEADRFLGDEISLRDEGIRKAVGLI